MHMRVRQSHLGIEQAFPKHNLVGAKSQFEMLKMQKHRSKNKLFRKSHIAKKKKHNQQQMISQNSEYSW